MQAGSPSGPLAHRSGATRGFLFADLRGYTSYVEQRGAARAAELLDRYRALVRAAVAEHEGAEIRTEGDSFYVVFPSASSAVVCATAIVQAARAATDAEPNTPVRVGVGVHAGETIETSEGFVGSAVNLAARLCAAAGPGEVLVSDTVRALTSGVAPVRYLPAGRRRLKGIAEPVAIYRATHDAADEGSSGRRIWPATRRAPAAFFAGAGMIVLIGVSLVIASFIRESAGSTAGSPTPSAEAASVPSATEASTEFPTAGEEALLALVDESYRGRCERAEPGTLPTYVGPGPRGVGDAPTEVRRDPTFAAGIICSPFSSDDPDEVAYWVLSDIWIEGGAEELIVNRAAVIGAPGGSCAQDRRALETWSAGPVGGKFLCFSGSTSGATLYWVYDGTDVMGRATRSDGDLDRLLRWFSDEARLRQP